MHRLYHILTWAILLLSAATASAKEIALNDSCLNKCEIFYLPNGQQDLRCSCGKSWKRKVRWSSSMERAPAVARPVRSTQLLGISKEAKIAIRESTCDTKWQQKTFETHKDLDLKNISEISNIPVCECLNYRARFPLQKTCNQSQAGENFCTYKINTEVESNNTPVRKISWLDIQACELKRNNYRKPSSCLEENCKSELEKCSPGYELVNIADSGSCCPKYFCKLR